MIHSWKKESVFEVIFRPQRTLKINSKKAHDLLNLAKCILKEKLFLQWWEGLKNRSAKVMVGVEEKHTLKWPRWLLTRQDFFCFWLLNVFFRYIFILFHKSISDIISGTNCSENLPWPSSIYLTAWHIRLFLDLLFKVNESHWPFFLAENVYFEL